MSAVIRFGNKYREPNVTVSLIRQKSVIVLCKIILEMQPRANMIFHKQQNPISIFVHLPRTWFPFSKPPYKAQWLHEF